MRETVETLRGLPRVISDERGGVAHGRLRASGIPRPVARTWDLSIHAAEQQYPAARPLLELLAFFAPEALPLQVLDDDFAALPELLAFLVPDALHALPEGFADELARNRAIGALNRFSLIRAEGGSITVHRLVQAVTRAGLDETTAETCANAAVWLVARTMLFDTEDPSEWAKVQAMLPHVLATVIMAEQLETDLKQQEPRSTRQHSTTRLAPPGPRLNHSSSVPSPSTKRPSALSTSASLAILTTSANSI